MKCVEICTCKADWDLGYQSDIDFGKEHKSYDKAIDELTQRYPGNQSEKSSEKSSNICSNDYAENPKENRLGVNRCVHYLRLHYA